LAAGDAAWGKHGHLASSLLLGESKPERREGWRGPKSEPEHFQNSEFKCSL